LPYPERPSDTPVRVQIRRDHSLTHLWWFHRAYLSCRQPWVKRVNEQDEPWALRIAIHRYAVLKRIVHDCNATLLPASGYVPNGQRAPSRHVQPKVHPNADV